jgi:hypothetical protein
MSKKEITQHRKAEEHTKSAEARRIKKNARGQIRRNDRANGAIERCFQAQLRVLSAMCQKPYQFLCRVGSWEKLSHNFL